MTKPKIRERQTINIKLVIRMGVRWRKEDGERERVLGRGRIRREEEGGGVVKMRARGIWAIE